ncbi:MAG: hypothetical protein AAF721_08710 [Myxococcota bacterium]
MKTEIGMMMVVAGLLSAGCDVRIVNESEGTAAEEGGAETGGQEAGEEGGSEEGGVEEGGPGEGGAEEGGGEEDACLDGECEESGGLEEGGGEAEGGLEEGGCMDGGCEEGGNEGAHCGLYYADWACNDGEQFDSFVCDSPDVCGQVSGSTEKFGEPGIDDLKALDCVILSLRDGEAATHTLHLDTQYNAYTTYTIESLGDGTAVLHRFEADDKCADVYEDWSYLKDAAYFEGCLEIADDIARFECVADAVLPECVEADTVCP